MFHFQIHKENKIEAEKILDQKSQNYLVKQKKYPISENIPKFVRKQKKFAAFLD